MPKDIPRETPPETCPAKEYAARRKPAICPACGSPRVASVLYGLIAFDERLQADLAAGRVVLGGCCLTRYDPVWRCVDCETPIYRSRA